MPVFDRLDGGCTVLVTWLGGYRRASARSVINPEIEKTNLVFLSTIGGEYGLSCILRITPQKHSPLEIRRNQLKAAKMMPFNV
jgi:hypothetical protein